MAAYVISEVEMLDETQGRRYRELAAGSIARHGGRYLVRGADPVVAEGTWPRLAGTTSAASGAVTGGLLHLHPHHHADRAGPVLAGVAAVVLPGKLRVDPPAHVR